jgi:hypothetical protein
MGADPDPFSFESLDPDLFTKFGSGFEPFPSNFKKIWLYLFLIYLTVWILIVRNSKYSKNFIYYKLKIPNDLEYAAF